MHRPSLSKIAFSFGVIRDINLLGFHFAVLYRDTKQIDMSNLMQVVKYIFNSRTVTDKQVGVRKNSHRPQNLKNSVSHVCHVSLESLSRLTQSSRSSISFKKTTMKKGKCSDRLNEEHNVFPKNHQYSETYFRNQ